MENELKQYLDSKFGSLDAKFAGLDAKFATKQDLERFATKEDLENMGTKLLTAFHQWSSPVESRARTLSSAVQTLDLEVEALRSRVTNLEKRAS